MQAAVRDLVRVPDMAANSNAFAVGEQAGGRLHLDAEQRRTPAAAQRPPINITIENLNVQPTGNGDARSIATSIRDALSTELEGIAIELGARMNGAAA